ncbi:MAG: right-handed parallel beta-helix repeat-containing protein, partial [Candidatus Diapherotrites archaeon]|nr:right-handed parallel beta-helix repeat-containing protein [Candidatus Diapherotrites archaeon]
DVIWSCIGQPSVCSWIPPIGVPDVPFGIEESVESVYGDSSFCSVTYTASELPNGRLPNFVDVGDGNVVCLESGVYTIGFSFTIDASGTPEAPVFFRGLGGAVIVGSNSELRVKNSQYLILENLGLDNIRIKMLEEQGGETHHIAIRHNEVSGLPASNASTIAIAPASNVVVYNNHVHHNGESESTSENDVHGVLCSKNGCEFLWVVDNHIHHSGGDSFQIYNMGSESIPRHIYVGRNLMHDDGENALDIKCGFDVIASQNKMYGYADSPKSEIFWAVTGGNYGDKNRVWLLFNEIFESNKGIVMDGSNSLYIIGNKIYDIPRDPNDTRELTNEWASGSALEIRNQDDFYFVGNTINNTAVGINLQYTETSTHPIISYIANNIFGSLDPEVYHLNIASQHRNTIHANNNLFKNPARLNGLTIGESEGQCQACLETNPLLDSDLRPLQDSPAVNNGAVPDVYQIFYELYGLDISVDFDGNPRPVGEWDVGAFEFQAEPPQECVSMPALMGYVAQWKAGSLEMVVLMQKINSWKTQEGC